MYMYICVYIRTHTHLEHKKDNSNHRLFELRIVSQIDDFLFHTRSEVLRHLRHAMNYMAIHQTHSNSPSTPNCPCGNCSQYALFS